MIKKQSKNLLLVALIILSASCQSKLNSSKNPEKETKIEESSAVNNNNANNKLPYETLTQNQAEAINKATEEEIQEVEDRIFFAYDSSDIDAKAKEVLDVQSSWLRSDETIKIIIEGHCDERGTREYNLALGERRANATKEYLVKSGISASRIKTISYGKERPAFLGDSEENLSKNRRAVTVIN